MNPLEITARNLLLAGGEAAFGAGKKGDALLPANR
jgi:hypothetical protein